MNEDVVKRDFIGFMAARRISAKEEVMSFWNRVRNLLTLDEIFQAMKILDTKKVKFLEPGDFYEAVKPDNDFIAESMVESMKVAIRKFGHLQPTKVKDYVGDETWHALGGKSSFDSMCRYNLDDHWKWKQVRDRALNFIQHPGKIHQLQSSDNEDFKKLVSNTLKEI